MTRDLARDLSDIDVAGITGGLLGAETIVLSPEQTAQLATVPRAQPIWRNGIEETTAMVLSPILENGAVYAAGISGRLVRYDPATGKQTGNVDTRHQLSGGVGSGNGMLLSALLKVKFWLIAIRMAKPYGRHRYLPKSKPAAGE